MDLSHVQQSLTIEATQITPMPNFPDYVMGLMSSQNQVFMAMDLAHLVGLTPQTLNLREYQTIVARVDPNQTNQSEESELYGLSVRRIQGVSQILPEQFESSVSEAPEELRPFLSGFVRDVEDSGDRDAQSSEAQSAFLIDLPQLFASYF